MKHSHGNHSMKGMGAMSHSHHAGHTMGKQIIKGSMASASVRSGGKLAKHPVLVFGIGVVAGYVIYKYRKEIVNSVGKATDASKDFVL